MSHVSRLTSTSSIHLMPKKNLLAICLLVLCTAGNAQSFPSDSALTRILQSDVLLPLLIDSAVKNSPEIKRGSKSVALFEENLQTSKKSILNSVFLTSNYGYGNTGSLSLEKDLNAFNQGNYYTNIRSSRYNIGVNLQLPLGNLLSRKNTARAVEIQIGMAEDEKANAALFVRQEVIKVYQELKLSHAHLITSTKAKQTAFISMNMVQKNFMDGQATVEQLSKQQNDYNTALMEYDTHLNKFQTSFLLLENYTGVHLSKLISRIR